MQNVKVFSQRKISPQNKILSLTINVSNIAFFSLVIWKQIFGPLRQFLIYIFLLYNKISNQVSFMFCKKKTFGQRNT